MPSLSLVRVFEAEKRSNRWIFGGATSTKARARWCKERVVVFVLTHMLLTRVVTMLFIRSLRVTKKRVSCCRIHSPFFLYLWDVCSKCWLSICYEKHGRDMTTWKVFVVVSFFGDFCVDFVDFKVWEFEIDTTCGIGPPRRPLWSYRLFGDSES